MNIPLAAVLEAGACHPPAGAENELHQNTGPPKPLENKSPSVITFGD